MTQRRKTLPKGGTEQRWENRKRVNLCAAELTEYKRSRYDEQQTSVLYCNQSLNPDRLESAVCFKTGIRERRGGIEETDSQR